MRVSIHLVALVMVVFLGCTNEPRYRRVPSPGPAAIPPAPRHPKIEGNVESVSSADIREVIRLKRQDMLKEYGKVLPIYTVRVHGKNHIEVQYWGADGIEFWRDARRIKRKWKFDELDLAHAHTLQKNLCLTTSNSESATLQRAKRSSSRHSNRSA